MRLVKKGRKNFVSTEKVITFAIEIRTMGYGVMVTQQILVLFFQVRVLVAQHKGVCPFVYV